MGVRTTADEHKDEGIKNLKDAIHNLRQSINEDVWGGDDWNSEYKKKLRRHLFTLEEIYEDIK